MRSGTWNVRNICRTGLLKVIARELGFMLLVTSHTETIICNTESVEAKWESPLTRNLCLKCIIKLRTILVF
jgi:hypothetical protein